jgi:hypothetical protein
MSVRTWEFESPRGQTYFDRISFDRIFQGVTISVENPALRRPCRGALARVGTDLSVRPISPTRSHCVPLSLVFVFTTVRFGIDLRLFGSMEKQGRIGALFDSQTMESSSAHRAITIRPAREIH